MDDKCTGHKLSSTTQKIMCCFQTKGPSVSAAGIRELLNGEIFFLLGTTALFVALSILPPTLASWPAVMTTGQDSGTEGQRQTKDSFIKQWWSGFMISTCIDCTANRCLDESCAVCFLILSNVAEKYQSTETKFCPTLIFFISVSGINFCKSSVIVLKEWGGVEWNDPHRKD